MQLRPLFLVLAFSLPAHAQEAGVPEAKAPSENAPATEPKIEAADVPDAPTPHIEATVPTTRTSESNRLVPVAPETQAGIGSVDRPLPSVNSSTIQPTLDGTETSSQTAFTPFGAQTLTPVPPIPTVPADPSDIGGQETRGGDFNLKAPNGVIYDGERGIAFAQKDIVFTYREFTVRGQRAVIDYNSNTAILSDNLTVTARLGSVMQTFTGQSLRFNLVTGEWTLSQIRATFPPEFFPPGEVLEPLYIRDGQVVGEGEDAKGENFTFSSCDRDHYYIRSKSITFRRDAQGNTERIALKKNAIYVFGRKLLPVPSFVINLQGARSRNSPLQPTFGQNAYDGFFAKTVYGLAETSRRTDSLLIDALQKRGLGLGLQRELAGGAGLFYLYALSGTNSSGGRQIDARIQRNLQIAKNLRGSLNFNSTQNNALSGSGFRSQNGSLSFNYAKASTQSSLLLSNSNTGSPLSSFSQKSASFSYRQQLDQAWNVSLNSRYNNSSSTGSTGLSTLDNIASLNRRSALFDASLGIEAHNQLTGENTGSYQLERLPELLLNSDSRRLGGGALDRYLPGEFVLSLGRFNEPFSGQRLNRTSFAYSANTRTLNLVQKSALRSQLNVGGKFGQSLYSDNTARYDYTVNMSLSTGFGKPRRGAGDNFQSQLEGLFDPTSIGTNFYNASARANGDSPLQLNVDYFKLRPVGYTPFQFDFLSPNENVRFKGVFQPSTKARLEFSGGRDLQRGFNNDLIASLRLKPSPSVGLDFSTSYSLENSQLGDLVGNAYITRSRRKFFGGAFSLGVQYSPQTSTLAAVRTGADIQLGAKTRLQALAGYNGYTKRFETQQFRLVRDLHCFNLYATYDGSLKQFRLDLALKAFPFTDSRLGYNRFGESFDPTIQGVQ